MTQFLFCCFCRQCFEFCSINFILIIAHIFLASLSSKGLHLFCVYFDSAEIWKGLAFADQRSSARNFVVEQSFCLHHGLCMLTELKSATALLSSPFHCRLVFTALLHQDCSPHWWKQQTSSVHMLGLPNESPCTGSIRLVGPLVGQDDDDLATSSAPSHFAKQRLHVLPLLEAPIPKTPNPSRILFCALNHGPNTCANGRRLVSSDDASHGCHHGAG